MSPARASGDAQLDEIRDCLASEFAMAMSGEDAAVKEILEHQLERAQDREKWRPLREAIDAVGVVAPTLRATLEAKVRERFDARRDPGAKQPADAPAVSLDSLTLVSEDEIQEEIALGNCARRLRETASSEFFLLNARLAAVLGSDAFSEDASPVHARVFARALLDVFVQAGTPTAARLAAFAAHDPALLQALPRTYKAANALLVKRGVLPDLKHSYGAPLQVSGARASMHGMTGLHGADANRPPSAAAAPAPVPAAQALFDRLLAGATAQAAPAGAVAAAPAAPAPGAPAAAVAAAGIPPAGAVAPAAPDGLVALFVRPELAEALRNLEARLESDPHALATLPEALRGAPSGVAYHTAPTAEVVRRARDEIAVHLTPADTLVADLVAAMFARLFENPEVSDIAKVQLGRLQLPVFKAVMADRQFFNDPKHPIRGMIDAIAELGASEDAYHIDGKLPEQWLTEETQALLDAKQLDAETFAAARDRLVDVAARHHEMVSDSDTMVRSMRRDDAEFAAMQEASLELAHRLATTDCPQAAAAFIYRAWRPVLAHDHRTMGGTSLRWTQDLKTLDDLVWALTPRVNAAERERLATLLPTVRIRLWQGLIRAQFPSDEIEAMLDELDGYLRELENAPLAAAKQDLATTIALGPVAAEDFTATLRVGSEAMGNEGLARGAWFEFDEEDGTIRRARIAWVSPVHGACVFKDVARNKSFAMSLADLRARRERNSARPVDGPGVADSSIEAALNAVARERGAAAPA